MEQIKREELEKFYQSGKKEGRVIYTIYGVIIGMVIQYSLFYILS